ncbi:MAG: hypothetical protein FIB07_00965 [Candidatus Methanoperedens sp.]|nr:hypothetical protein [Candidatus Methanoperedens sp.]
MKIINFLKNDNAQVNIDYMAGIGIFLLSVFFVFQFINSIFTPFQSSSDQVTLAADRAGTVLVERMLHSEKSSELNVIDQDKLYYFNNTKLNYSNPANYNAALLEIGLSSVESAFNMNVTVAYLNGTIMNQYGTGFPLLSGPALPGTTDIGQIKRIVLIINSSTGYNETAILSVRVW